MCDKKKNAETVGRATKRAARELTGDDGNFIVTTDLGNEFATLDRELPAEAVRRTKRPENRDAIAVVDRGIQTPRGWRARAGSGATASSGRPGPTTRGPTRRCTARPRTWRSSRPRSSGSSKTTPTSSAQQGPHRPAVEDAGAFRAPTNAARSFNPRYGDVQTLLKAGAAGQRQRGGPADETGQAGDCEAARLPGSSEAPRKLEASPFWRKKNFDHTQVGIA